MKRITSYFLVLVMICMTVIIPSAQETILAKWNYDNSILVTINIAQPQKFTPDDFPEIDCVAVYFVSAEKTESGYSI